MRAIDILGSVSKYKDPVAKAQVTSLERDIGLRAVRILENLSENESFYIRRKADYEMKLPAASHGELNPKRFKKDKKILRLLKP